MTPVFQIAHAFGYRVVGVDVGEARLEFVRSLGAAHAVGPDEAVGLAFEGLEGHGAVPWVSVNPGEPGCPSGHCLDSII